MFKLLTIAILVLCILFSIGVDVSPKAVGYADPPRTPTSTPENQELVNLVNELIRDESCVLPCWWGWNIGEDNIEQVQTTAERIWGHKLTTGESEDYIVYSLTLYESMNAEIEESLNYLGAFVDLWIDSSKDQLIASRFYVGFPRANYADLEPYMIAGILSKYGVPDEVTVDLFAVTSPIELILRYEPLNLYVQYNVTYDAPYYPPEDYAIRICNNLDNIVEFQMQVSISPEDVNLPTGFWDNPASRNDYEFDIEEASHLSLEEFTEVFSRPNQCFETLPISVLSNLESTS